MTKRKRQPNMARPPATDEPAANDGRQDSDFFAQLQHLSAEEWHSGHKVYIYRIWPVIDKRDEQHYVAKVSEPFDEDVILRNWGFGKYLLKLNNGRESLAPPGGLPFRSESGKSSSNPCSSSTALSSATSLEGRT